MVKTVPIKKNHEFMRAYKKGKFQAGKFLVLYALRNNLTVNRLGITVSKRAGKSVVRNRLKRLIRENYRLHEMFTATGYDFVFVARNSDSFPDFYDIRKEMRFLFRKLKVLDQEKWESAKES